MPGIYGVANSNNAKVNLEIMADAMYLYDHFIQDELLYDEQLGASRAHTGQVGEVTSPAKNVSNALWIEGEAYNVSDVADELGLDATSFPALLLAAENSQQLDKCLNRLDGYFCAALYNAETRKLKLISDRYGMRLLYWYHKDGVFAWGSEVKAILAVDGVDKELDPTSYDCFMDLGYLMGEHTWFEHIKLIKPATVIEYDLASDAVSQHHYWKWSEIKPSNLTFDEAVDELGKRFIEAVRRRFDPSERIGISLSGGLDSRAIFAAVDHLYPDYKAYAYTFGIPGCDDITIAEQVISRSKNWKHEKFYFSSDNWFEPRKDKIWNTDGMQDMMHMHGSEFLPEVAQNIGVNLNGYCGDAIIGGGFLVRVPWNLRITRESAKLFYGSYAGLTDIDSDFYNIEHVEPNLHMNRVRRFTAYGSVNALPWLEQRKPFFDNKLVELVFSIPDEYRANNRLYSAMLQKYFPKYFRDIPWQQTGKPAAMVRKPSIPTRAIRKAIRTINGLLGIKSTHGYTDYPNWIRNKEISEKLSCLLNYDSSEYKTLSDIDLANRWLQPHLDSNFKNYSNQILRAATIELYLQRVFRG
ncbi:asparagine synthase-related protein [Halomonas alkalicola]|uniref:asparagine synthase-related protein n=1 Tax=Halomonas alkalicola TaxID=1930622 RepID=UPI00265DC7F4|nr:asparagine synthase-related protein [Halomonas alkalicola]